MGKNDIDEMNLRHLFISMLFALVIGQLAVSAFEVFSDIELSQIWFSKKKDQILHLMLPLFLITTSWVGWSNTFKDKNYPKLDIIWSKGYILLLIDIIILILYFSLIKSVDKINDVSSSKPEAIILSCVFGLYFLWDLIYSNEKWKIRKFELLPSLILFILCLAVLICSPHKKCTSAIDVLLIAFIFLFRLIKEYQIEKTKNINVHRD